MKLWYSNTSPYVRKVRAVAVHHALDTQIESRLISATAFSEQAEHNRDTPLGRIPVLQTDEGTRLYSSNVIAEYLDAQGSSHSLSARRQALGGIESARFGRRYAGQHR